LEFALHIFARNKILFKRQLSRFAFCAYFKRVSLFNRTDANNNYKNWSVVIFCFLSACITFFVSFQKSEKVNVLPSTVVFWLAAFKRLFVIH